MKFNALLLIFVALWQLTVQHIFPNIHDGNFKRQFRSRIELVNAKYKYEYKTIDMPVDHFDFASVDKFKLRYLMNDTWVKTNNAPIFFYTGNEGDIEGFAQNSGFMWDIAPEFGALLIFAEHRYYGESMPYGNKSYTDIKYLGYLSSEQALADYVDLIQYLRSDSKHKHSPVIVFGGSYGGMLSAWMRMKYPHIVQGAIACSAPILQFTTECEVFSRIVTSDFKMAHRNCPKLIRKSWNAINNITSNDEGKKWLSENWKLCQPLKNENDVEVFKSYLSDIYGNFAMVNYPYASDFLAPLPPFPIKVACEYLTNESLVGKELLTALHDAVNVFTNYTGETKCLNLNTSTPQLNDRGWHFQACTEMVMPLCSDGINDMFEPTPWNFEEYSKECEKLFSIKPQPNMACNQYGCEDLSTATNIVFRRIITFDNHLPESIIICGYVLIFVANCTIWPS